MPNHPGKYLANAYESLKLASNTAGTPVCGKTVRAVAAGGVDRLLVERTPTQVDTLVPSLTTLGSARMISVAQGGRQIATTGYRFVDTNWGSSLQYTDVFRLSPAGVWARDSVAGAFMAIYLERDTAYVRSTVTPGGAGVGREDLWVRIGATERQVTGAAPTGSIFGVWTIEAPSVTPTGDWVLFRWLHATPCGTDPNGVPSNYDHFTLYAAPMTGGAPLVVTQNTIDWCASTTLPAGTLLAGATAWRADARGLIEVREAEPANSAVNADEVIRRFAFNGTGFTPDGGPVTVSATRPHGVYWEHDGARVRVAEEPNGQACRVVIRGVANLGTVLQTLPGCDHHPTIGPSYVVGQPDPGAAVAGPADPALPPRYARWAAQFLRPGGGAPALRR